MRRAGVILSIGLISLGISSIPARAASLDGPPQIAGVEFGTTSVAVSGVDVASFPVSIHLKDSDGVNGAATDDLCATPTPLALVRSASTGRTYQVIDLALSSGTINDGWWSGDVHVGSLDAGELRVSLVVAYDTQGNRLGADPASSGFDPRVTVNGSDPPALSAGFSPRIIQYPIGGQFKGRLTHAETGAPFSGKTITIYNGDFDCGYVPVVKKTTTDANGYWGVTLTNNEFPLNIGAVVDGPPDSNGFGVVANYKVTRMWWSVWSRLSSSSIRLGSTTTVVGSVAPAGVAGIAYLQRLVSGVWKTVATTTPHSSGRFYLTAHPPSRGYQRYRVLLPADLVFVPTATRTMTLYVY